MKRMMRVGIIILVPLLVLSCAALFEFNLFDGLDKPRIPSAEDLADMGTADALDELDSLLDSDDFVEVLTEDPDAQADIIDYLDGVEETGTPAQQQQAHALEAEIIIATSPAGPLINGFIDALFDEAFNPDSGGEEGTTEALLGAIMPDNEADFILAFNALADAGSVYSDLNTSIGEDGYEADINMGDVVMNAAIAALVAELADPDDGIPDNGVSGADLYDWIFGIKTDPPDNIVNADFSTTFDSGGPIGNIIDAAFGGDGFPFME